MMDLKKMFNEKREERKERKQKEKVLFDEAFEKERKVVVQEEATAKVFAIRQKAIKKANQDPLLNRIGAGTLKGSILMAKGVGNIAKEVQKLEEKKSVKANKVRSAKKSTAVQKEEPESMNLFNLKPEDVMLGGGKP